MVWLYKLIWLFKPTYPPETMCEHCGRHSPYYYHYCPYCDDDDPDILSNNQ